jgi:catechol 2,3-dioxygenase-like lactoylglutathione lyase family enzyme
MAAAQVVLPCDDLEDTVDWFTAKCGFRLLMISPADDPSIALLEGHGLQVRLDRSESARDTKLRILVEDPNPNRLRSNSLPTTPCSSMNECPMVRGELDERAWSTAI